MYDARQTAGVLPRECETSLTARVTARLRPVLVVATSPDTPSPIAASIVAAQVRKSLAEKSSPVASLRYSLMSGERTSVHERPFLYASSSGPPPRRRLSAATTSKAAGSTTPWIRRLPLLAT